jgi:tRNA dimethylallyltransferase
MKSPLPKVLVVLGPTSSGKSDFGVELALKHNGEVISADSRQIYRGLDIGTGKITESEMKGVPHHMIDICDINEPFSVADYSERALPIIEDILARGKTPIICGGTGQYIDALIYENSPPKVGPNKSLRAKLETHTTEELYAELLKKDLRRAKEIDKHNKVRLVRALEIIDAIGVVPTQGENIFRYDVKLYLMNPTKELLEERVHKRLLKRFDQGMIQEMESLIAQGYDIGVIASKGIEYKWMAKYLENEINYDELVEHLRIATWQYAKRQRTWNKKYESFAKLVEVL